MQKRWVLVPEADRNISERLQEELGVPRVLADLLVQRGVHTFEEARDFFRPSLDALHDPFLMKDMDRAIQRIDQAISRKEGILIYGDYDVDGTTAVALVYGFFREFHHPIGYYLPDRYTEGYGLSEQGIDHAVEQGYSLIITLDCGIKANERVEYARARGIDVIIADHHLPGPTLPAAHAVLDPKRADCPYPYKELSGCGIGFKLVQAFIASNGMDPTAAHQYLDLVAVSIASDIVPITGENRILAHYGLAQLNSNPCCGLQALIELSDHRNRSFTINDILFQLGPRINAAGRIDHARDAVRLLISRSLNEAAEYGDGIDVQNTQRKDVDLRITEEAFNLVEAGHGAFSRRRSTVLYKEDWHRGVIGIVASRLVDRYYRPTVILTRTETHVTGSARSIAGVDLYAALSACSSLLDQYGGHKYAAGLTMRPENIAAFEQRFEEVVAAQVTDDMMIPEVQIDAELSLSDIDARFFRILNQFEPFGPLQEQPVFVSRGVRVHGRAKVVAERHLKMDVTQNGSALFPCIGFGLGHFAEQINASGEAFDICYTLEENVWRNKRYLQLHIRDVRNNIYLRKSNRMMNNEKHDTEG